MTKARDLANAGTALTTVSATELGYLDGVTSAIQNQFGSKVNVNSGSLNLPTLTNPLLFSPEERVTSSATAATGTINFDVATSAVINYTANATGDWTLNVRGDSGTSFNNYVGTSNSMTIAFLVANGTTAYKHSALTIDGSAQTVKWSGGTAPSAGNASSIDAYSFTIIKTASATYTVLGAGPIKYA
jgi:hypothetical protein